MRFIHISDLHIGKKMSSFPLDEDQRHILREIVRIATEQKADAVLIAGDIYDSTTPASESFSILSEFLVDLSKAVPNIFMIAGNHDSADKLAYGGEIFERSGIHIASKYDGTVPRYTIGDEEKVDVYLLSYIRVADVRNRHPDEKIESYEDAVRIAVSRADTSGTNPKVIVAHQYVTYSGGRTERFDSEMQIGGQDNVDFGIFKEFDYVALGHIHGAQQVGRSCIRYCGTPLKYSKSEAEDSKSVTVVDMGADDVTVRTIPLTPLRGLRVVRGRIDEIIAAAKEEQDGRDDFIYAELTEYASDAMSRLRELYPNVLGVSDATEHSNVDGVTGPLEEFGSTTDIREEFAKFFKNQTGTELTETQKRIIEEVLEEVGY